MFPDSNLTWQSIELAITGMGIVFAALILISLFVAALPRTLVLLNGLLPPETDHPLASPSMSALSNDEEEVVAIGVALHERLRAKSQTE
jgi:oxaloacetate decarboxylase gamma subunit